MFSNLGIADQVAGIILRHEIVSISGRNSKRAIHCNRRVAQLRLGQGDGVKAIFRRRVRKGFGELVGAHLAGYRCTSKREFKAVHGGQIGEVILGARSQRPGAQCAIRAHGGRIRAIIRCGGESIFLIQRSGIGFSSFLINILDCDGIRFRLLSPNDVRLPAIIYGWIVLVENYFVFADHEFGRRPVNCGNPVDRLTAGRQNDGTICLNIDLIPPRSNGNGGHRRLIYLIPGNIIIINFNAIGSRLARLEHIFVIVAGFSRIQLKFKPINTRVIAVFIHEFPLADGRQRHRSVSAIAEVKSALFKRSIERFIPGSGPHENVIGSIAKVQRIRRSIRPRFIHVHPSGVFDRRSANGYINRSSDFIGSN